MNYLFVCTGNTCRSPMAEALMRARIAAGDEVRSAGVAAWPGRAISPGAVEALSEIGLGIGHTATRLDRGLVDWADLILVMESMHRDLVIKSFPWADKKIRLISEWAGRDPVDIEDPLGSDAEGYRRTRDELARCIELALGKSAHG